jgi:YgiT-type zinc finger domain-containing protein
MAWETTTHYEEADGRYLIFEHVPAVVCDLCGETALRGSVLNAIERVMREQPVPTRVVEASVYDFAELGSTPHEGPGEADARPASRTGKSSAARHVTPPA